MRLNARDDEHPFDFPRALTIGLPYDHMGFLGDAAPTIYRILRR